MTRSIPKITDGLIARPALLAQLGCAKRTLQYYERDGLPVEIRLGNQRFYHPGKVRAWLSARVPRRCGRPPKQRALEGAVVSQ